MGRIGLTGFELPPESSYDSDDHLQWLLAKHDQELLEWALYRLPPHVVKALAGVARAYYSTATGEHVDGVLDDSFDAYQDDCKTRNEE